MDTFPEYCFLQNKGIIKFKPEKEIKLVEYNEGLWKKLFFHKPGLNYKKLQVSNIGLYSAAKKEHVDPLIYKLKKEFGSLKNKNIIDGNGGVGNISILMSYVFKNVCTIEIMPEHSEIIKNNIFSVYNRKNIVVINDDFMNIITKINSDMLILDLPWGGTDYSKKNKLNLGFNNVNIVCIINKIIELKQIEEAIILFAPSNYNIQFFIQNIKAKNIEILELENTKNYWIIIHF